MELDDVLKKVQMVVDMETRPAPAYVEHQTENELKQNLFVYREGAVRVSDRLIVTIGRNLDGELDIVHALMSRNHLKIDKSKYDLSFILEDDAQRTMNQIEFSAQLNHLEFEYEKAQIDLIDERLEFYNAMIASNQVKIVNGQVYIQTPLRKPVATTPEQAHETVEERRARAAIERKIKNAVPHSK
jgi:hypothetical protein